jgi:glycosyltransferase involved in cell wall biosynthesis
VRVEGIAAAVDRARDRVQEWRAARRATRAESAALGPTAVLDVLGFPPVARLGGVPLQLRNRHAHERALRPVALLAPWGGGWRVDWRDARDHRVLDWDAPGPGAAALEDAAFEDALGRARSAVGAGAIHFEGLAGVPPRSALRVARGSRLVVTVHDFTPYCPRPHLWEGPAARFCAFSRDEARCHACLSADFDRPRGFERDWRAAMADLLAAADAIVFPSAYLREAWRALLPALDRKRQHVVEPGAMEAEPVAPPPAEPVRRVALVGASTAAKGAALLPDVVRAADGLRFTVLGGGDADILRALRRLPRTRVRGYYRAGALPRQLAGRGIGVALILSLVPESYGMTLDECWQAGVPVVAFDHGAIAERVRRLGGGVLVPLERGALGIAEALRALRDGAPRPDVPPRAALTTPAQAARTHVLLYRRLGLLE